MELAKYQTIFPKERKCHNCEGKKWEYAYNKPGTLLPQYEILTDKELDQRLKTIGDQYLAIIERGGSILMMNEYFKYRDEMFKELGEPFKTRCTKCNGTGRELYVDINL